MSRIKKTTHLLQEFSVPLISGVVLALVFANVAPSAYAQAVHWLPFGPVAVFGHELTLHFLVNDVFMVFFFGIAAKEITESILPGGDLNPPSKAINPLLATIGGVVGPVGVFFAGLYLCIALGIYGPEEQALPLARGWGIPTATDIALAWLVARAVFGRHHPAVNFLLLLAVADDAIGLGIIAVFYGDPQNPAQPIFLGLVVLAMAVAWLLRKLGVKQWWIYIGTAGPISWSGLVLAHLHPALALVFVVPFLPGPPRDEGLFAEAGSDHARGIDGHSPLHQFEHSLKATVDFGLFFFAFANAGVAFSGIGTMTWLILASLVIGKVVGITAFSLAGVALGIPLPTGMMKRDLAVAGFVAALGLTVALFVAGAAFTDPGLQGQAKMGALFSGLVGPVAIVLGRLVGAGRSQEVSESSAQRSAVNPPASV